MYLELTVDHDGRRHDVAIAAPGSSALASVLTALAPVVGAAPGFPVWHGDRRLDPTTTIADAGLRVGTVLTVGHPPRARAQSAVLSLHVVGGPAAGSLAALGRGRLVIGREPGCDVVLPDPDVSRRHAAIEVDVAAITVHDLGSTNGTTVDGRPVPPGGRTIRPGDLIALGDSLLTVAGPVGAPAALQPTGAGTDLLLRAPRRCDVVADTEIARPSRASSIRPRGVQWLAALLPAVAGAAIALIAGAPQFLLFALLSPILMVSTALGDRVHWRRTRRRDAATYRQRLAAADRAVAAGLAAEAAARRAAQPDPAALGRHVGLPTGRVWERRRGDADLLQLRLGTARLPSTLRVRHGTTVAPAARLEPVPLTVGLRAGPLGVAGPPGVVTGQARWLVGQLAALHSPTDVELALLLSADRADEWSWARWLPHLRGRVAVDAAAWPAFVNDLTVRIGARRQDRRRDPGGWAGPWLVLVIDRAAALAEVPGLTVLLDGGSSVGLTAICIDAELRGLPTHCASVARVDGVTGTRLLLRTHDEPSDTPGVIDQVTPEWSDAVARGLAPLVDAGAAGGSAIPDRCGLLDGLGLDGIGLGALWIEERWATSSGGARTVIGRGADGPVTVDLVADGPHALVAGTTGSGKSELLQTLVAALAANHPPDEINFLLIDYKGGAAFADCARLPHTAGLVTDLDPYLTERALRSLHSELRRRERLFAATGSTDLAAYRAVGRAEPIARLVIVVDEFATLADELPDFVRGLVAVAQRGRSLGVHLVLATQRPGSSVSAEIRANTSLRIALRVTDAAESTDVVGVPDAAAIERWLPGRACLRTGSTFVAFQTAHPGATDAADPNAVTVEVLGEWRRPRDRRDDSGAASDVARLVRAITDAAARRGSRRAQGPWQPPLPDVLSRAALGPPDRPTAVGLARVDLPDEQKQTVLGFDLGTGTTLLAAGGSRSGRTSLLAALAIGAADRGDPTTLQVHVLDGTGTLATALRPLPHCTTVLGPDDLALAPRLLRRLESECLLRGSDGTGPDTAARLLLLIDGWPTIVASLADLDAAMCVDTLGNLLRIGPAAGLSVAVTGDRSSLAPRFSGSFAERLLLPLPDPSDYGLAGVPARHVPATMPPGRALRAVDGAALQIAHAGRAPGIEALRAAVADLAARSGAARAGGPRVIAIRSLPARVPLAALPAVDGRLRIGLAGDNSSR